MKGRPGKWFNSGPTAQRCLVCKQPVWEKKAPVVTIRGVMGRAHRACAKQATP